MSVSDLPHFTRSGLPGIETVPFGMHACHFYASRDELAAALTAFFMEGLRANERCLWITAPPLPAAEAAEALRAVYDGVDEALEGGALRILDYDQWYQRAAHLKGLEVVQLWLDEEEQALADGYNGLRITGNVTFLKPEDWPTFVDYEQAVTTAFSGRRIVALCSYAEAGCDGR
jgi:two-component system, sensor histidine kinase PdtaS